MPYKEFEPRDTLEKAMSKLWGDEREAIPTTRLEEMILKIADAQPTGIHAVPNIEETDVGKALVAGDDGAEWSAILPAITESDEGKVLMIVDGEATWVDISDDGGAVDGGGGVK